MAVRSQRVVATSLASNGGVQTLYTVPTDRTLILKSAQMRVFGATQAILYVATAAVATAVLLDVTSAGAEARDRLPPGYELVLHESDTVNLFTTAAGVTIAVWVSGSLLEGDPA